jgi:small conductance mechanosensitive channel
MDTASVEAALKEHITSRAEVTSAYLDVIMEDLSKLQDQLAALPTNSELAAKIAVTQRHMLLTAEVLRQLAAKMESLGIDATAVNAQLIGATGALTTDIFDISVISRLAGNATDSTLLWISDNGARIMFQALIFVAILLIAWRVASVAEMVARKALQSARVDLSQLLRRMIISATRGIILLLGLLIGLSQLGFSLGPLLAGLGIAGFIIGFALQDSLSNFASGLMILIYRPFDVGDLVDVNGAFGTVRRMSHVNTTILTFDNQTLVVPNNQVWQNVIKNLTAQHTRRVDMMFGIAYSDDVEKAERILHEIVAGNDKILAQPQPIIKLHELGESSVNFVVRPWVKTDDYWDAYWDIARAVKVRFDAEGISIPFPQRDVHLFTDTGSAEQRQT